MPDNELEDDYEGSIMCGICVFLVLCAFIAISLSFVEPGFYGMVCNKVTKTCDVDDVKVAGRYFTGPIKHIIQFPGYQVSVMFKENTLKTRTKEGLELDISLSFQYRLIREQIPHLYFMNNMKYEETFIRIARDTIMKSAGHYMANQYWEERTQIQQDMLKLLNQELTKAYAHCTGLQLLNVELPSTYERSIVDTQVEQQKQKLKSFEQTAVLIRKDIDILRSDNDQKVLTINSQASADAFQIQQQAVAEQQMLSIDAESNVATNLKGQIGLNGQEMRKYLVYNELKDKKKSNVVIGLDNVFMRNQ